MGRHAVEDHHVIGQDTEARWSGRGEYRVFTVPCTSPGCEHCRNLRPTRIA